MVNDVWCSLLRLAQELLATLFTVLVKQQGVGAQHVLRVVLALAAHPADTPSVAWASLGHSDLLVRIDCLKWLIVTVPRCTPKKFKAMLLTANASVYGAEPLPFEAPMLRSFIDNYVAKYNDICSKLKPGDDINEFVQAGMPAFVPSYTEGRVWKLFPHIDHSALTKVCGYGGCPPSVLAARDVLC